MTKTNITIDQAIAAAKTMTAAEFQEKYEDQIEWLDVNLTDFNEGTYLINFIQGPFEVWKQIEMLFIDGKYQQD